MLPIHYPVKVVLPVVCHSCSVAVLESWQVGFCGGVVVGPGHVRSFCLGSNFFRWSVDVLQGISAVRCLEWDVLLAVGDSEGLGLIFLDVGFCGFGTGFLRRDSCVCFVSGS